MSKVILGGGLIGLLAREILGAEWTIIPNGSSRFYGNLPPLADYHIVITPKVADVLPVSTLNPIKFTRAFSYGGELIFNNTIWASMYMKKVFGEDDARKILFRIEETVSRTSAVEVFQGLMLKYREEILANHTKFGKIVSIDGDSITTTNSKIGFNKAISTIPLDALMGYMNIDHNLESRDIYIYHVECAFNLEGADQVLVVDEYIDFYKVNAVDENNFVFFSFNEILDTDTYFRAFLGNCKVINSTKLSGAFPIGNPPDLKWLGEKHNIYPVGSCAEWDDFVDISTSVMRLLKVT